MYQRWQHSVACRICFRLQPVCAQRYTTYPCRHFHQTVFVAGVMTIFIKLSYRLPCTHGQIPHVHEVFRRSFWFAVLRMKCQPIYTWKFPDMTWLAEDFRPTSLNSSCHRERKTCPLGWAPTRRKAQMFWLHLLGWYGPSISIKHV